MREVPALPLFGGVIYAGCRRARCRLFPLYIWRFARCAFQSAIYGHSRCRLGASDGAVTPLTAGTRTAGIGVLRSLTLLGGAIYSAATHARGTGSGALSGAS